MNINEIAKLAGVSRATVSRYLNNGYVSDAKKEIIAKVIAQTGYQPSNSAQTLRSKKTNYIGVIIPKINSDSISRMVAGISTVLSEQGYQLLLACSNNKEEEELNYLSLFKENHVDGIILVATIFTPEHLQRLKELTIPIVILGQKLRGYSCIFPDDYAAAYDMADHLGDSIQKCGILTVTEKDAAIGTDRFQGLLDGLGKHNLTVQPTAIATCSFSMASGYEMAGKLLQKHPDIDTLLCVTDTLAIGAMKYIHEQKKVIPVDLQIAGFGDGNMASASTPTLTTVHFFYKTSGMEAAKNLLEMIEHPTECVPKEIKLGYRLVPHESTRTAFER